MVVGHTNCTTTYTPDARLVREGGYVGKHFQRSFLPGSFTEKIDEEVRSIVTEALDAHRR
jgi:hypothetical protein